MDRLTGRTRFVETERHDRTPPQLQLVLQVEYFKGVIHDAKTGQTEYADREWRDATQDDLNRGFRPVWMYDGGREDG